MSIAKTKSSTPVSLAKKADLALSGSEKAANAVSKVDGLALVVARNSFYQQHFYKILYLVIAQVLAIVAMAAVLFRLFDFTASRDYYFPISDDNQLVVERALYEPVFSDDEIKDWVQDAVTTTMTFGYYDYTMRWQDSRTFFTPQGWEKFTKAMDDIKWLERIGAIGKGGDGQVVAARLRPGYRPEIKRQGILNGRYVWELTMPVDVSLHTEETEQRFSWTVDVRVVRMKTVNSRYNCGIDWLVAERRE